MQEKSLEEQKKELLSRFKKEKVDYYKKMVEEDAVPSIEETIQYVVVEGNNTNG